MESSNLIQTHSGGDSQTGRCELRILRRDRELRRRGCDAGAASDERHDHVVSERPPHDERGTQFLSGEIGEGECDEHDVAAIQGRLPPPHFSGAGARESGWVRHP